MVLKFHGPFFPHNVKSQVLRMKVYNNSLSSLYGKYCCNSQQRKGQSCLGGNCRDRKDHPKGTE